MEPFALFISSTKGWCRYFGTYCQPVASDYLGRDEILRLPNDIKKEWARRLGTKPLFAVSKPRQTMEALSIFYQSAGQKSGNLSDIDKSRATESLNSLGVSDIVKAFAVVINTFHHVEIWTSTNSP